MSRLFIGQHFAHAELRSAAGGQVSGDDSEEDSTDQPEGDPGEGEVVEQGGAD